VSPCTTCTCRRSQWWYLGPSPPWKISSAGAGSHRKSRHSLVFLGLLTRSTTESGFIDSTFYLKLNTLRNVKILDRGGLGLAPSHVDKYWMPCGSSTPSHCSCNNGPFDVRLFFSKLLVIFFDGTGPGFWCLELWRSESLNITTNSEVARGSSPYSMRP
jgi:hypothetical protein